MTSVSKLAIAITLAGAIAGLAGPAVAGCKRMGFLVNDYGKEGPTNDAKSLLDKHIAQWAAEQGIEKYTVGKKDVKCDLFLNLIVVDEHTCTASATVCWGNEKMPAAERETAAGGDAITEPKSKKPKKEAAAKAESKPQDAKPTEDAAAAAKPAEIKVEEPKAAAVETSAPTKVETGALPVADKPAEAAPQAHEVAKDAAEAAAAAAERAAAAAERAALAAERAAAALASSGAAAPAMPGAANTAAAAGSSVSVPPLAAEGAAKP
jgi:hypothetical protein